jgi:hypothetical protein
METMSPQQYGQQLNLGKQDRSFYIHVLAADPIVCIVVNLNGIIVLAVVASKRKRDKAVNQNF